MHVSSVLHCIMPSAERKAVIKNTDMSEDWQQYAIDYATQAMEKFNIILEKRLPHMWRKSYALWDVMAPSVAHASHQTFYLTDNQILKVFAIFSNMCSIISEN